MEKMLAQGAEAKIYLREGKVVKERILKGYRNSEIDKQIRKRRTKQEAKILYKAKLCGVHVPDVFNLDEKHHIPKDDFIIVMEYIEGDKLSDTLNDYSPDKQYEVMKQVGKETYLLHANDIIHGDLTTSNTILRAGVVYIIDFGLGYFSAKIEDKAVDLHLIRQALEAKHYMNFEELFKAFLDGYKEECQKSGAECDLVTNRRECQNSDNNMYEKVIEQLKKVDSRGKYKEREGR